jgi:hypothetical protein
MWSDEDLTLADEHYKRDIDKLMEDGLYNKYRENIDNITSSESKND